LPRSRFRLRSITIEGFKGFTEKQSVALNEEHAFLFGKNSLGKSSVVEAVRWCLFGLAERPETEVRNAFFDIGECMVEMELKAPDGIWHIKRRLRPGADRSRATITNPKGKVLPITEVFPYLARMGPREGTHVIFAAQQETGRRPQADISDFHKVLYSYLHIEEVPDLLDRFAKLLEEQSSVREDVASEIDEIEDDIRTQLTNIELSLKELLRNPPWLETSIPTLSETENKVYNLAQEIAGIVDRSLDSEISTAEALECIDGWCEEIANTDIKHMQEKLEALRDRETTITNLLQMMQESEKSRIELQKNIGIIEEKLKILCEGQTLERLKERSEQLGRQIKEENARLSLAREAEEYCTIHAVSECPICLTTCNKNDLLERIARNIKNATPEQVELHENLEQVNQRFLKASELDTRLTLLRSDLEGVITEFNDLASKAKDSLQLSADEPLSVEYITQSLVKIQESLKTFRSSMESKEFQYTEWKKRVEALKRELRFHQYRREQDRIQRKLTARLEPIRDQLAELLELENALHKVKEIVEEEFGNAIDRTLPKLNEMMTEVYNRLTGQTSFEKLLIQRTEGTRGHGLQFKVGSERSPGQHFNPEDVLNGQASSALRLVPYFVFSQFHAEALELDLLLIDDPSQSFDTSHVKFLLKELATAGTHAQLIIATHEEERFSPLLHKYFKHDEHQIVRFTGFEPKKGPSFVIEQ